MRFWKMENRHTILVAGFDHHQKQLRELLTDENFHYTLKKKELVDDFGYTEDDQIYQYERESYPLHIQAEPDNPYDPQAVKVFADDTFIGYVPKGRFGDLIHLSGIPGVKATVEVFGGKYKYAEYNEEADFYGEMDAKYYSIRTDSSPVKAVMVFEW